MNGTLNKVILIGHLGDEVKMHYFEGAAERATVKQVKIDTNHGYDLFYSLKDGAVLY